jgi:uncharacterized membrane protein
MSACTHLWAVGFGDTEGASRVRDVITSLGYEKHQLILLDVAMAVRYGDGSFVLNGDPFPCVTKTHRGAIARLLAGLALGAPPLTGAAVDAMYAGLGATAVESGISDDFVRQVEVLIKPGSSVVFVLDQEGDMNAILHAIRGLGGTVLKTNVDIGRANLIQSTLAARADTKQDECSDTMPEPARRK